VIVGFVLMLALMTLGLHIATVMFAIGALGAAWSFGLPAVNALGVVGQIIEVSGHQARLMLIIDRNSGADALVQRTRSRGIVKGTSRAECYLDYVLHADDVRVGDLVVSSGFDGVFPKGLLIGTVTAVDFKGGDFFKDVQITPAVDFDKLEEVLVILGPPPGPAAGHR